MDTASIEQTVVIIGGGPAGLMAAEKLSYHDIDVTIIDSQKRVGKKFLVAGDGGLNLTHSEPLKNFVTRYEDILWAKQIISNFTPNNFIKWLNQIGITTFAGSSGRIFPNTTFKPAKVLTVWVEKLKKQRVQIITNTQLLKINYPNITIESKGNQYVITPKYVVFAMGGKSWKKTGSNGNWTSLLNHTTLLPSNVGLHLKWSDYFVSKFEGQVLKYVAVTYNNERRLGDVIITKKGLESTPIYHISAAVVKTLSKHKKATIHMDLKPNNSVEQLATKVNENDSWQQCFKKWNLKNCHKAIYVEIFGKENCTGHQLAERIKNIPLSIKGFDSFDEAIATQGGIPKSSLTEQLAFKEWPNWFAAGEMLNQDAPTGGYLIQHAVSSGYTVAQSIIAKQNLR